MFNIGGMLNIGGVRVYTFGGGGGGMPWMMPMGGRRGRGGGGGMYAFMLFAQLLARLAEMPVKPPVTLLLVLLNVGLFAPRYAAKLAAVTPSGASAGLRRAADLVSVRAACLMPARVLARGERYRLVVSSLVHLDEVHLLWNMLSFLHKGVTMETELGSAAFAALVVFLSFVSHSLYVVVAKVAAVSGYSDALMGRCVAGFSGVLFGLGAIMTSSRQYRDAAQNIFGFSVPKAGVSVLVELVSVQLLVPGASFLGHLCGALAGFSFVVATKALAVHAARAARGAREARAERPEGDAGAGHAHSE